MRFRRGGDSRCEVVRGVEGEFLISWIGWRVVVERLYCILEMDGGMDGECLLWH